MWNLMPNLWECIKFPASYSTTLDIVSREHRTMLMYTVSLVDGDETGQISRDPPTKSLLTRRERLANLRNAPAVVHGFISSCTYVERPRPYLQFSTREFAISRFCVIIILHLLQKTHYLQAWINSCHNFFHWTCLLSTEVCPVTKRSSFSCPTLLQ